MAELPEIELLRRDLDREVSDKKLKSVDVPGAGRSDAGRAPAASAGGAQDPDAAKSGAHDRRQRASHHSCSAQAELGRVTRPTLMEAGRAAWKDGYRQRPG